MLHLHLRFSFFKHKNLLNTDHKWLNYLTSSCIVNPICITIFNPIWTLKSVYIVSKRNDSILAHARRIYNANGLMGFQKGLILGYVNGINGVLAITLYDVFRDILNMPQYTDLLGDYTKTTICSSVSKVAAYLITFPIFACRIRHQIQQKSAVTAIKTVMMTPTKIYSGLLPTLMIAIPKNSIMFLLKDNVFNKIL